MSYADFIEEALDLDPDVCQSAAKILEYFPPEQALECCRLIIKTIVLEEDPEKWRKEIAVILASIPITEYDPQDPLDRHLALEVADILGDDWAQAWYRFVVLVTKIAGAK